MTPTFCFFVSKSTKWRYDTINSHKQKSFESYKTKHSELLLKF